MRSAMVAMLVSFLSWIFMPAAGRSPESGEVRDGAGGEGRQNRAARLSGVDGTGGAVG